MNYIMHFEVTGLQIKDFEGAFGVVSHSRKSTRGDLCGGQARMVSALLQRQVGQSVNGGRYF